MSAPPAPHPPEGLAAAVQEALRVLDKHSLVLAIHDPSFPSVPEEDIGRGSPYALGGRDFFAFAASLGFTGVQLGPQGLTTRKNPSPYDATLFSRNPQGIGFALLTQSDWRLLKPEELAREAATYDVPEGTQARHQVAWDAAERLIDIAWERFRRRPSDRAGEFEAFRQASRPWLQRDAAFDILARRHGTSRWWTWPEVHRQLPGQVASDGWSLAMRGEEAAMDRYAFAQWVVHVQHAALRQHVSQLGLMVLGDVQVGLSRRDAWAWQDLVLKDWRLGAPPSGTNPMGQPWGFQLLDPRRYRAADGTEGEAMEAFRARMAKMLTEYDGLRLDHPHGLVDPWVYSAAAADPLAAVQNGARLFSSPGHPVLGDLAIAHPSQIDGTRAAHDDGWVRELTEDQVARYGILFEVISEVASAHGRALDDFLCEVLSTCPYPLQRVMTRHGLGRFRVTQKARLDDPTNVYRSENAEPQDWIMPGNHDTPPLRLVLDRWEATGELADHSRYLASRLVPPTDRESFAHLLRGNPSALFHAQMADLLASPSRHVMVFFADLFGMKDVYNAPGTVSEENWSLRAPREPAGTWAVRRDLGEAWDLPASLVMALQARGLAESHSGLVSRLRQFAGEWFRGLA